MSGVMARQKPSKRLLLMISEKTGASIEWLETGQGEPYQRGGTQQGASDPPELVRVINSAREAYYGVQDEGDRLILAGKLIKYINELRNL